MTSLAGLEAAGIGLAELARRFLQNEGVDVDRAIRDLGDEAGRAATATRRRAEALRTLARKLRKARADLDAEMTCWRSGVPGCTLASVTERQADVETLRAALREACQNDPDLIAAVQRDTAW